MYAPNAIIRVWIHVCPKLCNTAHYIWGVLFPFWNLNRWSGSLGHFCHVVLKRDQWDWDWRLRSNDTPNAIGCTNNECIHTLICIHKLTYSQNSRIPEHECHIPPRKGHTVIHIWYTYTYSWNGGDRDIHKLTYSQVMIFFCHGQCTPNAIGCTWIYACIQNAIVCVCAHVCPKFDGMSIAKACVWQHIVAANGRQDFRLWGGYD